MRPQGIPRRPRRSPSFRQGVPEESPKVAKVPQEVPKDPQGVPQGFPRGPQGVPKGSPRVTGRLRSRWNDGVAPKSAALLDALRTSCERRAKSCLHIERLSTSLTSWYDFSHTLRGLDRRNPRKLTTVQHFSMVSMVLRCRQTTPLHDRPCPWTPLERCKNQGNA